MCMSSTPKVTTPTVQTPDYLHNPFLDSASINGADFNTGRNSLVNQPGSADYNPVVPNATPDSTVVAVQKSGVPMGAATGPATSPSTGLQAPAGAVIPTIGGAMAGALPNSVASVAGARLQTIK